MCSSTNKTSSTTTITRHNLNKRKKTNNDIYIPTEPVQNNVTCVVFQKRSTTTAQSNHLAGNFGYVSNGVHFGALNAHAAVKLTVIKIIELCVFVCEWFRVPSRGRRQRRHVGATCRSTTPSSSLSLSSTLLLLGSDAFSEQQNIRFERRASGQRDSYLHNCVCVVNALRSIPNGDNGVFVFAVGSRTAGAVVTDVDGTKSVWGRPVKRSIEYNTNPSTGHHKTFIYGGHIVRPAWRIFIMSGCKIFVA